MGQIMKKNKNNGNIIFSNYFSKGFMVGKVTEDVSFALFIYRVQIKPYQWRDDRNNTKLP